MTTVNAPCSLLALNEFYRNINPTDPIKAVNSFSNTLVGPKQRKVTVWVTISEHQDYSGHMTNAWTVGLILRSLASSRTKCRCLSPADRVIK